MPIDETLEALTLMRERFKAAEEAEQRNREAAEKSLKFYFGEQWDDEIERQRKADGRPCFTERSARQSSFDPDQSGKRRRG
jgi:hypothetical protein